MDKNEDYNDINMVAMKIIMDAGDARVCISKSISEIKNNSYEQAEKYLGEAQEKIKTAHERQTSIIQDEVRGVKHPFSFLFSHAQDTLMTISSELNITKEFLEVFKANNQRIQKLEEKDNKE